MVSNVPVFILGVIVSVLASVIPTVSGTCAEAFSNVENCDTSRVTTMEQLMTDACPKECQSLLNDVMSNCTVGTSTYLETNIAGVGDLIYQEALLYGTFFQAPVYPMWKSCDYGYSPTACDEALGALDRSRFPFGEWAADCDKEMNVNACSPGCVILIEAVVEHCDMPDSAKFAPNGGYLDETHTVVEWESPKSMQWLGFDPNKFDIVGTLSKPCWETYEKQKGNGVGGATSSATGSPSTTLAILTIVPGVTLFARLLASW